MLYTQLMSGQVCMIDFDLLLSANTSISVVKYVHDDHMHMFDVRSAHHDQNIVA